MSTAATTTTAQPRLPAHSDPSKSHYCPCGMPADRFRSGWCCARCAEIEERGGTNWKEFRWCGVKEMEGAVVDDGPRGYMKRSEWWERRGEL